MFGLGSQELLVILIIVLVLKEFKKGIDEAQTKEASINPPSADRDASTSGERRCGQCKSALAPDWTHCPRCGTAATQGPNLRIGQGT